MKRFLQKTGQLKAKKKTMMSEVKHSTTVATSTTAATTTVATTTTAMAAHDLKQSPAQLAALEKEGGEGGGDQGTSMETGQSVGVEPFNLCLIFLVVSVCMCVCACVCVCVL